MDGVARYHERFFSQARPNAHASPRPHSRTRTPNSHTSAAPFGGGPENPPRPDRASPRPSAARDSTYSNRRPKRQPNVQGRRLLSCAPAPLLPRAPRERQQPSALLPSGSPPRCSRGTQELFYSRAAEGSLPAVSWLHPPIQACGH
eukprot:4084074-Prymnesium_polylepis.1